MLFPAGSVLSQNKKTVINPAVNLPRPPAAPKRQPSKEQLAQSYYYGGEYEKAAQLFAELYKKSPRYNYYRFYYNSLIKTGKYKEAEKLCKKQVKMAPENYRFKIDLAYIYSLEGDGKKVDKILNRIMTDLPDNRTIVTNIAANLQARGFYDQAVYVYDVAREKHLGNYDYNMELATAYRYAGDYDKMFDALIAHLNAHPKDISRVESQIQNLLIMDVDNNLADLFRKKILLKAQKEPTNPVYAELLMWYSLQIKDFDLALRQAKAIDKRFRDQEGKLLDVADVAYSNGNYKVAADACAYLLKKKKDNPYYAETYEKYFKARLKLAEENPEKTDKKVWEELERTGEIALEEVGYNGSWQIIKELAHLKAFRLNKTDDALKLLNEGLAHASYTKEKAELKMEKADILAFTGKFWDASLLYSQVEEMMKNEPLGHEAKFRNARLFYYKGEFQWSKTRLDVLKGSTSKFIANDALELSLFIKDMLEVDTLGLTLRMFAAADQYAYQQKYDSALLFLNKIEEGSSLPLFIENVLFKKGNIYEKKKEYRTADSIYSRLSENYPESIKADNALFRQAEINRLYLHDPEKAKKLYLKLMKDYPESIYATEARKRYREME
jgi:tetratricopeptide (TPR) repeat protein